MYAAQMEIFLTNTADWQVLTSVLTAANTLREREERARKWVLSCVRQTLF